MRENKIAIIPISKMFDANNVLIYYTAITFYNKHELSMKKEIFYYKNSIDHMHCHYQIDHMIKPCHRN